jgi:isopentenyl-diphosphate Delta-isomerase
MPLDDQTELFYLVDENDNELESVPRAEAHADRTKIHRSVQIVLSNAAGQVLLQKRSMNKDKHPGKWTVSASGHVTYGQSYQEAAIRELAEELGVSCKLSFVSKSLNVGKTEQEYAAIFVGECEETPTKIDKSELDEVKWFSRDELARFCQQEKLTFTAENTLKKLKYL